MMHKSGEGMVWSLLHQILAPHKQMIPIVFPEITAKVLWTVKRRRMWYKLLCHRAAMNIREPRSNNWRVVATIFIQHLHSSKQVPEIEDILAPLKRVSEFNANILRQ